MWEKLRKLRGGEKFLDSTWSNNLQKIGPAVKQSDCLILVTGYLKGAMVPAFFAKLTDSVL